MKNKTAVFIATWFYSGFLPVMPGTHASLLALPLCYFALVFAEKTTMLAYPGIILLVFLLGLWSVPRAEIILGPRSDWQGKIKRRDQNQIVIDEVFGTLASCCPLLFLKTQSLFWGIVTAFFLFRFFDIVKIPPINIFDRMESAIGVMLDDFMAGTYAALLLLVLMIFVF